MLKGPELITFVYEKAMFFPTTCMHTECYMSMKYFADGVVVGLFGTGEVDGPKVGIGVGDPVRMHIPEVDPGKFCFAIILEKCRHQFRKKSKLKQFLSCRHCSSQCNADSTSSL